MNTPAREIADATVADVAAQTLVLSGVAALLVAGISAAFVPMPTPLLLMFPIALIPPVVAAGWRYWTLRFRQ